MSKSKTKARNSDETMRRQAPTATGRPRKPRRRKPPPNKSLLTQELAYPEFTGIRTLWHEAVSPGLTPQRLAAILHGAETGSHWDYLTLAEEMEERELHYRSVLDTRKRAIGSIEPVVEAGGEDARSIEIADAVEDLVRQPPFRLMIEHLGDAVGKGFAVSEIMWETSASQWMPYDYVDVDPRFFTFDEVDRKTLRLMTLDEPMFGRALEPFKFLCHVPRLKSGIPIRGGLAKPAAWGFIFKSYTLKDWVAFAEVYGIPFRLGKYGPQATAEDKARLLAAVRNIGTDAAGIVPETMAIEFVDGAKGSGARGVFDSLTDYIDKQISKVVLGQTMTTDHGSSMAQAKVHENVRHDIKVWDGGQAAITVNRDLVRPFVDLNYGPQKRYPTVSFPVPKPEDLTALSDVVDKVVRLGVRVREQEVRERIGFSEPDEGDAILTANGLSSFSRDQHLMEPDEADDAEDQPAEAEAPGGEDVGEDAPPETDDEKPAKKATNRRRAKSPPVKRKMPRSRKQRAKRSETAPKPKAANHAHDHDHAPDELDRLRDEALADWQPKLKPIVQPILDAARAASSYDDFVSRLPLALARMDTDALAGSLAIATTIARGLGDVSTTAHKG